MITFTEMGAQKVQEFLASHDVREWSGERALPLWVLILSALGMRSAC